MNELKFSLLSIDEKKDGDKVEKEKQIPAVTGHCYWYKSLLSSKLFSSSDFRQLYLFTLSS